MFNRKKYKQDALNALKNNWKWPIVISLVYLLINACFTTIGDFDYDTIAQSGHYAFEVHKSITNPFDGFFNLIHIIVAGILTIALSHVFLTLAVKQKPVTFTTFTQGLELWLTGILGTLWFMLWFILWSALFFIPGIIKAISYSQMFFILAENPKIGPIKAMDLSKILTKGHKADIFVMILSFTGWLILSLMSAGIGLIWLTPYYETSFANAYLGLKEEAFRTGYLVPADFS